MQTVFILDDDPDLSEALADGLAGPDLRVSVFTDSIRALEALSTSAPLDLLITDVYMPWIDGQNVLSAVRLRRPNVPIIVISGDPRNASVAQAQGLPFLCKPIELDDLENMVDGILKKARRRLRRGYSQALA